MKKRWKKMPNSIVTALAKESGKSVKAVEKLWKKAKEITADSFGKTESEFTDRDWSYVTGVLKNMLGLEETVKKKKKVDLVESFISSEKSFDEFYEEDIFPVNPVDVIDYGVYEEEEDEEVEFSDEDEMDEMKNWYGEAEEKDDDKKDDKKGSKDDKKDKDDDEEDDDSESEDDDEEDGDKEKKDDKKED